tara:strand:- start:151 stop:429 length:279 start_codon:yes stop_codon:yes gene_type:complete
MSLSFTLVVFPVDRTDDWEWIAGTNLPGLSSNGNEPATHHWFSIQPTDAESSQIDSVLTGDEERLSVDLNTQSPQAVIEDATGLKQVSEDSE